MARRVLVLLIGFVSLGSAVAGATKDALAQSAGTQVVSVPGVSQASGPAVPYEVTLEGDIGDDLREALEAASSLVRLRREPPATVLGLRRRVLGDVTDLRKVLEGEGYYAAILGQTVDANTSPAKVTLRVEPGPRYGLRSLSVTYAQAGRADDPTLPHTLADLTPADPREAPVAKAGMPARADTVLDAIDRVQRMVRERGYPKAEVEGYTATVDHQDRSMAVTVSVAAGTSAVFGPTTIRGAETVNPTYLRRYQPWSPGDRYDVSQVEAFRRQLLATGLFSTVTVGPDDTARTDGTMPMVATVEENDHRSLGAGARYSTSLGPGLTTFWEHRNFLGEDEDFRAEAEVSGRTQSLSSALTKPHFWRWDQSLKLSSSIERRRLEAYDRNGIDASAGLERRLSAILTAGIGVSAEHARVTGEERHRATLFGLPLTLGFDDTDNLLDPRRGLRLSLAATPYTGVYDGPVTFGRLRGEVSTYSDLSGDGDTVLGSRVAIGAMVGAGRGGVPPDKRFYAGGGGSVRGFGYQMAGALDDDNDPVGGKSLVEVSLELRQKVTETIGLVPFVDVGRAYEASTPTLREDLFLAFGLGGRYYSPVGPVRLDIAFPVRPRRDIDDRVQIYVSLGQAF